MTKTEMDQAKDEWAEFHAARAVLDAGDLNRAAAAIGQACRRFPASALLEGLRAECCLRQRQFPLALAIWQRLAKRVPTFASAPVGIVQVLLADGRALQASQAAVEYISRMSRYKVERFHHVLFLQALRALADELARLNVDGTFDAELCRCLRASARYLETILVADPTLAGEGALITFYATALRASTHLEGREDRERCQRQLAGLSHRFGALGSGVEDLSAIAGRLRPAARPRIAVLVVGQLRSHRDSLPSLVRFCEGFDVSYFFVSWNKSGLRLPTPEQITVHHLERSFPKAVVEALLEAPDRAPALLDKLAAVRALFERPVTTERLAGLLPQARAQAVDEAQFEAQAEAKVEALWRLHAQYQHHTTPLNSAKMTYMNAAGERFLGECEAASGVVHDYVLRIRPDVLLKGVGTLYHLLGLVESVAESERDHVVVVDHVESHPGTYLGDIFTFCTRAAMRSYCSLWQRWDEPVAGAGAIGGLTLPHLRLADYLLEQGTAVKAVEGLTAGFDSSRGYTPDELLTALVRDQSSAVLLAEERRLVDRMIEKLTVELKG